MAGSQHSILFALTLVAYGSSVYTGLALIGSGKIDKSHAQNCSKDLVWQSRTGVCCEPYFNCPQGYGITECTVNGEPDLCQKCPNGQTQTNMVSSLNMDEAHCFSLRHTEICPEDTKPSRRYPSVSSCVWLCECKNDDCYYGEDSCRCGYQYSPCGAGETMNRTTGECEKCLWFEYKLNSGCGPCLVNVSLWRQGQPDPTVAMTTTTSSTKGQPSTTIAQTTPEPKVAPDIATKVVIEGSGQASEHNYPLIITIVALVVIVLIGLGLAFVLLRTGSCNLGGRNQTSMVTHAAGAPAGYTSIEQHDRDHLKGGVVNGCFQCANAGHDDNKIPLLHEVINELRTDSTSPDQGLNAAVKLQHSELQLTRVPSGNVHPNREPAHEQVEGQCQGQSENGTSDTKSKPGTSSDRDESQSGKELCITGNTMTNTNIQIYIQHGQNSQMVISGQSGDEQTERKEKKTENSEVSNIVSNTDNTEISRRASSLNNLDDIAKELNILPDDEPFPYLGSSFPLNSMEGRNMTEERGTFENRQPSAMDEDPKPMVEGEPNFTGKDEFSKPVDKADNNSDTNIHFKDKPNTSKDEKKGFIVPIKARPVGKVAPMCRAQSTPEPGHTVDAFNRSVSEGDNPSSIENASMGYAFVDQASSTLDQSLWSELDRNQSFSNGIYEDTTDESIIHPSEKIGEQVGPKHTQNTSEIRNPGNDEEETLLKTPYPGNSNQETIPKVIDDGHVLHSDDDTCTQHPKMKTETVKGKGKVTRNDSPDNGKTSKTSQPTARVESLRMSELKEFNFSASDRDRDSVLVVKKGEKSDTKKTNTKTSDTKGQPAKVTNTGGDDKKQGTNVHTELPGSGSAGYTALGSEVNGERMDEIADFSLAGVDLSDRFLDSTDHSAFGLVRASDQRPSDVSDRWRENSAGSQAMRHTGNQIKPEQARGEHSNLSIELTRNDSVELSQEEIDSLNREVA